MQGDTDNQELQPRHFEGKTIKTLDVRACNLIVFAFTDGTQMALHIDCSYDGIPSVLACDTQGCLEGEKP